jgi:hypothetical protein
MIMILSYDLKKFYNFYIKKQTHILNLLISLYFNFKYIHKYICKHFFVQLYIYFCFPSSSKHQLLPLHLHISFQRSSV